MRWLESFILYLWWLRWYWSKEQRLLRAFLQSFEWKELERVLRENEDRPEGLSWLQLFRWTHVSIGSEAIVKTLGTAKRLGLIKRMEFDTYRLKA